jgi:hypothetical protein
LVLDVFLILLFNLIASVLGELSAVSVVASVTPFSGGDVCLVRVAGFALRLKITGGGGDDMSVP